MPEFQWVNLINNISSPIWGGIIVILILIRFYNKMEKKKIESNVDNKKCPKCAEWIKMEAIVCRFCGNEELLESDPDLELICPECGENKISRRDGYCDICRKLTLGRGYMLWQNLIAERTSKHF